MKKRTKVFLAILLIVIVTLTIVFSATYAFFTDKIINQTAPIEIDTGYVEEELILNVDKPLSLTLNSQNLTMNGENVEETATATIRYKKRENVESSTFNYYLYLVITDNTFVYSDGTTPEIILSITKDDVPYTLSLGNLSYDSSINGYDITTKKGILPIAVPNEITSTSSDGYTTHIWKIKITCVNLSVDQGINFGSVLNTQILLQKTPLTFANYVTNIVYTGTDGEHDIYKHDGVGTYTNASEEACWEESGTTKCENSYRYSGTSPENYVCFGYSDPTVCSSNNFVNSDYAYRIIGVFNENDGSESTKSNQVKLIKANFLTTNYIGEGQNNGINTFYWQGKSYENAGNTANNTWADSTLNTDALNTRYAGILNIPITSGSTLKWKDIIEDHIWKVVGNTLASIVEYPIKTAYYNEIINPIENNTSTNGLSSTNPLKIGLLYMSDYGYSINSDNWKTNLNSYHEYKNNTWLFNNDNEWTITRNSEGGSSTINITSNGGSSSNSSATSFGVRPTFYLKSNVNVISGNGTISSPYMIG